MPNDTFDSLKCLKPDYELSLTVTLKFLSHTDRFHCPHFKGFRIAALVTNNETQDLEDNGAPSADQAEGSGTHGMYFRVNGALIWSRGANFIPMDQLDGRLTEEAHKIAVQSAAAANMNTLRVWGGGMILPEAFYDACDEMGLMLYHDMMFVEEGGHPPARVYEQDAEIRFVVRQLAHHPCIVLWDGCNEVSSFSNWV